MRFLATLEVVSRELLVLDYSHRKLFANPIEAQWVRSLEKDMEAAETLEAFVSRYSRVQDTIGQRLIPRALLASLEIPGSMLDNLSRAERLGWLDSAESWVTARDLRNRLVHEYMTDPQQFAEDIRSAGSFVPMFRQVYQRLSDVAARLLDQSGSAPA